MWIFSFELNKCLNRAIPSKLFSSTRKVQTCIRQSKRITKKCCFRFSECEFHLMRSFSCHTDRINRGMTVSIGFLGIASQKIDFENHRNGNGCSCSIRSRHSFQCRSRSQPLPGFKLENFVYTQPHSNKMYELPKLQNCLQFYFSTSMINYLCTYNLILGQIKNFKYSNKF